MVKKKKSNVAAELKALLFAGEGNTETEGTDNKQKLQE
jgi:hypothetical protein